MIRHRLLPQHLRAGRATATRAGSHRPRPVAISATLLATALVLLGCGDGGSAGAGAAGSGSGGQSPAASPAAGDGDDDGDDGGADETPELVPLTVSTLQILDSGPILLGEAEGVFEEHGLDIEITFGGSGATIVPTVLSGEFDIGYANTVSDLQAIDQGLPLLLVHAASAWVDDPDEDPFGIYVAPDGPIREPEDLASANIGGAALGQWSTKKTLENLGITEFEEQHWTQVAQSDAITAVQRGELDAIWLSTPSGASAEQAGLVRILPATALSLPGAVGNYFVTSQAFAQANPEALIRFNAAVDDIYTRYGTGQADDRLRAIIVEKLGYDPALVESSKFNAFPTYSGEEYFDEFADDLVRFGIISAAPRFEDVFWTPAWTPPAG